MGILDHPDPEQCDALAARFMRELQAGVTEYDRLLVSRNSRRLHRLMWQDEAIKYFTETDPSPDRVLDIFVRANDGGTKLSKADLLMSMITSKRSSGTVREDIFGYVDHINKGLGTPPGS